MVRGLSKKALPPIKTRREGREKELRVKKKNCKGIIREK